MLGYLRQPLPLALTFFSAFAILVAWRSAQPPQAVAEPSQARVVISAPVLVPLYAGDRFLAANIETIRLSATGSDNSGHANTFYLLRAHKVVSELNPCHENNYYIANALLTWGGAVEAGGGILKRASACRYWDELPPFLYGFNQYFFNHNVEKARHWLEVAAQRAGHNAAGFRTFAAMIQADQFQDAKVALQFLKEQRDMAKEVRLRTMLDKRVGRLKGLIVLREAQKKYEEKTGKPLTQASQLISAGILPNFPQDPLGLGYVFENGQFALKTARIAGVKERQ